METTLNHIGVIAYYEYRMLWRGRAVIVMTLAILAMTLISIVAVRGQANTRSALDQLTDTTSTEAIIGLSFIPAGTVFALLMPTILAELVPRDRQLKVRDLLFCTPISPTSYLIGKVLGGWMATFTSLVVVASITGIFWRVLVAPYDLESYLKVWVYSGIPLLMINSGIVILLAAPLPDNRLAILMGLLFTLVLPFIISPEPRGDWLDLVNPLRAGLFMRYIGAWDDPTIRFYSQATSTFTGIGQVLLAGLVAWGMMRRFQF